MSILAFGLGTTGQVSSLFGKVVDVELESQPVETIDGTGTIDVDLDSVQVTMVDLEDIPVNIELEDTDINVDKSCP